MNTIPTLADIASDVLSALESGLGITIPNTQNFLTVDTQVTAGQLKLLYLQIGLEQREFFPDTATSEAYGGTLERAGRIFLGRNPFPAQAGVYQVQVTGTIGAVIPASTTFKSDDSSLNPGFLFILTDAFTLVTGSDLITLKALTPGTVASLNLSDTLTCTQPLALVNQQVVVTSITTGAIDVEDLEVYRTKILEQIRLVAGSWSATDYRLVAKNITGVKQIYAYAYSGHSNQINVWIEGTVAGSDPATGVIDAVTTATELVRPLHVFQVNYAACPINQIAIQITQITALVGAQQDLIIAALQKSVNAVRPFIAACDNLATRNDSLGTDYSVQYCTNLQSVIASAIPGIPFGTVVFTVDSTPETTYTADQGHIPYVDPSNITFI